MDATHPAPAFRPRHPVRHRGQLPDEPDARVWRVTKSGVWVSLGDGRRVCWHPDDVVAVRRVTPLAPTVEPVTVGVRR